MKESPVNQPDPTSIRALIGPRGWTCHVRWRILDPLVALGHKFNSADAGCHTITNCLAIWKRRLHKEWQFSTKRSPFWLHEFSDLNSLQMDPQSHFGRQPKFQWSFHWRSFSRARNMTQTACITSPWFAWDTQAVVITLSASLIRINQSLGSDDTLGWFV